MLSVETHELQNCVLNVLHEKKLNTVDSFSLFHAPGNRSGVGGGGGLLTTRYKS